MSKDTVTVVARLKNAYHPSGQRITGLHKFTKEYRVATVSLEQLEEITNDPYLMVAQRNSESWLGAFGLDYTENNQKKYATVNPPLTNAAIAENIEPATNNADIKPSKEVVDTSERDEVIAKLVAKGKKEGKDFNKDASLSILKSIL